MGEPDLGEVKLTNPTNILMRVLLRIAMTTVLGVKPLRLCG